MPVKTFDEYINTLNEDGKKSVLAFSEFMESEHPQWKMKISFSMPMWMVNKKMNEGYIAISAAKNHFSIHFSDENLILEIVARIPHCKYGKRCINVNYGDDDTFQIVKEYVASFMYNN